MGFNKVYNCLLDIFPQVDQRILKAVAIENSKDADAAVEVVLTEILPALPVVTVASGSPLNNSNGATLLNEEVEDVGKDNMLRAKQVSKCDASSSLAQLKKSGKHVQDTSVTFDAFNAVSFVAPHMPHVSTCSAMALNQKDTSVETEGDELILFGNSQESSIKASANGISSVKLNEYVHEVVDPFQVNDNNGINVVGIQDISRANTLEIVSKNGIPNHGPEGSDQPLDLCTILASGTTVEVDDVPQLSHPAELASYSSDSGVHAETMSTSTEKHGGNGSVHLELESNEMENIENESNLDVDAPGASQICRIDILEEIIEDARNNKKTLLLAMQSVLNMVAEVELQEKAAEKAKEEAARAGLDTLSKVGELIQILAHAKEANDMHAGEIYGEKAILATEARELQSRLLTLQGERDGSLAILDEMRQTLEERRVAAEEARKVAEQEMLEKEESAWKVLAEQEAIMERVVQESKLIQQEAEENAKLRDFLMDRGQIVDSLQGEISVICEDVRLLKEKFDQRLPLSKSISSSQTSCMLASSGSSQRSTSSDFVVEQQSENVKIRERSRTPSLSGQSTESESADGFRVEHKDLIEDGLESWDLVENETEM